MVYVIQIDEAVKQLELLKEKRIAMVPNKNLWKQELSELNDQIYLLDEFIKRVMILADASKN